MPALEVSADSHGLQGIEERARAADGSVKRHSGWARVIRNTAVGFYMQAGTRMAAALSFYSILAGAPMLVLTLALGSALFGEETAKSAVTGLAHGALPPGGADQVVQQAVGASSPTFSLALLTGLAALFGYSRALEASLNVTLRASGTEPVRRAFRVGPLLLIALIGLLWGSWLFRALLELLPGEHTSTTWPVYFLLANGAPLILAMAYFGIVLAVVPRVRLSWRDLLVPAIFGGSLWEVARYVYGWLIGEGHIYQRVFGAFGGIVALLAWVYVSSVVLVVTGQFAWAYAMERRGRGHEASRAPKRAGPKGWMRPFEGDNAVNEDDEA